MSKKEKTKKKSKSTKTYVFDGNGKYLRARATRTEAVMSTREEGCFFFAQAEIKKGAHLKFFKKLKKYKGL